MPEYVLSEGRVDLRIYGRTTDSDYSQTLAGNPDLRMEEIILLDKIRKGIRPNDKEIDTLRRKNLVKGRGTMLSFNYRKVLISDVTVGGNSVNTKPDLKDDILSFIRSEGPAGRADIEHALFDKMPGGMTDVQKKNKISNIVRSLSDSGIIKNIGSPKRARYVVSDPAERDQ